MFYKISIITKKFNFSYHEILNCFFYEKTLPFNYMSACIWPDFQICWILMTHFTFKGFPSCIGPHVYGQIPDWLNPLWHDTHLNGFSPVCVRLCLANILDILYDIDTLHIKTVSLQYMSAYEWLKYQIVWILYDIFHI